MARKDTVSDWSATPNDNDNVGGINIAENCAAANLNNAIRTVMAQIKDYTATVEPGTVYTTKNADYTALLADDNAFFRFTSTATLALTTASTLTNGWHCWVMADGAGVTIDPTGADTINGLATLDILDGYSALIVCSGTSFYAVTVGSQTLVDAKLNTLQPYINAASAATLDLGAVASQNVFVTGTTTITSFGTAPAGTTRFLMFSSTLTLTNSPAIILPFGSNITTAPRAAFRAVSLGSGNWRVSDYQAPTNPSLIAGDGLTSTGSLSSGSQTISLDIYTGSSASQTTFPVGHQIPVFIGGSRARNSLVVPALHNSDDRLYVLSSDGSAGPSLAGTWRSRGLSGLDGNYYDVQRVA